MTYVLCRLVVCAGSLLLSYCKHWFGVTPSVRITTEYRKWTKIFIRNTRLVDYGIESFDLRRKKTNTVLLITRTPR